MKSEEYDRNYALESSYWWFTGVRAMTLDLINLATGGQPIERALDVGCGTGALLDTLRLRCTELWGLDISDKALAYCRQRGHENVVQGDAAHTGLDSEAYDLVTAIGVIEHLDDDRAFLDEMYRLVKPGGTFVMLTSSMPWLWSMHDVANEHKRRYYLRGLERQIEDTGFQTLRFSHLNFLLFPALATALVGHRAVYGLSPERAQRIMPQPGRLVNAALTAVLLTEAKLMRHVRLPWGVSMIGAFRK